MDRIYEYAILRFVPAAFRGEQVNVGLVILNGPKLDVRLYEQSTLLVALGATPSALEWVPSYLREQDDPELAGEKRWERLLRFPGFILSDRGWFAAENDEQYEGRVARIKADYVDHPRPRTSSRRRSTSLTRELRGIFRDYDVMGNRPEDLNRHKVVPNVAVGPAGKLNVDFVVKNGVYHATKTADFRAAHDTGTTELKEAALASITLQCARDQLGGPDTKCYLVYAAKPLAETAVRPALDIARLSVDEMFNMESGDQRRNYFDLILAAAGSPSLFKSN